MIPYFALFSWPLVSIAFFRRYSAPIAVLVTILAGYLLLPEKTSVDLPLLPALNKQNVSALTALALAALLAGQNRIPFQAMPGMVSRLWSMRLLLGLLVFGSFMTVMTNGDPLRYGPTFLPGLRPYDAFSYILAAFMFALPLLLARKYLATPQSHRTVLMALCFAGLGYSLLVLIETRMSPLLHYWVYGFFPHNWSQHVRGGGAWRPVVFLGHGLLVGIFLSHTVLAALGLARSTLEGRGKFYLAGAWLLLTLILSRNFGALVITLMLAPCILFFGTRVQLTVAAVITAIFLTYPIMRDAKIIPIDRIVEASAGYDPDRAASLLVRLKNEDAFLEKTRERLAFGWGGWGRSRTYHSETGQDISIADGAWVITLSVGGWTGYIARFGLVCVPIFLLLWRRRRLELGPETAVLTLILAGNLVDLIPNSSMTPITAVIAGALWGRVELGAVKPEVGDGPDTPRDEDGAALNPYTRQTRRITRKGPPDAPASGRGRQQGRGIVRERKPVVTRQARREQER